LEFKDELKIIENRLRSIQSSIPTLGEDDEDSFHAAINALQWMVHRIGRPVSLPRKDFSAFGSKKR
jgi:hypothetical protein